MTNGSSVDVDISDVIRGFHAVKINVHKAVPKLLARLSFKGEAFMKGGSITPYRTGTLRRSIHAYPTVKPTGLAAGVDYAFAANIHSRKPHFIERTKDYIIKSIPVESDIIIGNALKGTSR